MMNENNDGHIKISYSANSKYQTCPRQYYFHYLRKLREEKQGSPLLFGGAMDQGLNVLLVEKNNITKAKEVFTQSFMKTNYNGKDYNAMLNEGVKWGKWDLDPSISLGSEALALYELYKNDGISQEWLSMYQKGLLMLDAYQEQIRPHIGEVLAVQEYIKIEDEEGNYIRGYIDFVATWEPDATQPNYNPEWEQWRGKTIIFDNKTSSMTYKDDSVQNSDQLGTYSEFLTDKFRADAAGYIVIPKKIRKFKQPLIPIQVLINKVDDQVIQKIFVQYTQTIQGHKYGNFPPNFNSCHGNPFPCPYKNYCHRNSLDGLVEVKSEKER